MKIKTRLFLFNALVFTLALLVATKGVGLASRQATSDFDSPVIGEWRLVGEPESYQKGSLFGYIDGGAEIFLQYGFEELTVRRYADRTNSVKEKEMVLEIYRMKSAADAFGIFSMKRDGNEPTSPLIEAVHWIRDTQAGLVKGGLYLQINGGNTTAAEMEAFAVALSQKISAPSSPPPALSRLPSSGLIRGSERYIRGEIAAAEESPLLNRDFWGFGQKTTAVSAKYEPVKARFIVVAFPQQLDGLEANIKAVFAEYLVDVATEDEMIKGKDAAGRFFVFRHKGDRAFLILGEPDWDRAIKLLGEAAEKD